MIPRPRPRPRRASSGDCSAPDEGHRAEAIAWLERAVWLEPSDAWYHLTLALQLDRAGRSGEAQAHADVAVALRADSPWVRYRRALIARRRGALDLAALDLGRTLEDLWKLPDTDRTRDLERKVLLEYVTLPAELGGPPVPEGGIAYGPGSPGLARAVLRFLDFGR